MLNDELKIKPYCVYTHRDKDDRIFYCGSGSLERPFHTWKSSRNEDWWNHCQEYGLAEIDIICTCETKEEAVAHEEEFTLLLRDFGEPLTNVNFGNKLSSTVRAKLSAVHMGKMLSDETCKRMGDARRGEKNHNFGKTFSDETRAKLSAAHMGKTLSEEHRTAIGDAITGESGPGFKGFSIGNKNGLAVVFDGNKSMKLRGFEASCICECINGNRKSHKGFTWTRTIDREKLQQILDDDNFVDTESKRLLEEYLAK